MFAISPDPAIARMLRARKRLFRDTKLEALDREENAPCLIAHLLNLVLFDAKMRGARKRRLHP